MAKFNLNGAAAITSWWAEKVAATAGTSTNSQYPNSHEEPLR